MPLTDPQSSATNRILLVEDDPSIRSLYTLFFTKANLPIDTAENGEKALSLANQNPYSLILLDLMLPDTTGLEVLRQIKTHPTNSQTPVFLLSNVHQENLPAQAQELGIFRHFIKANILPHQLVSEVKQFLSQTTPSNQMPQGKPHVQKLER